MNTATLMVQGTTSDAGKSTLVTGLGRVLWRRGWNVAPFKPQNMALNSAVTLDGGEIGRAQALQAQACGLQPHSDMNPILLKPTSDKRAQVIVQGHTLKDMDAVDYQHYKQHALSAVLDSYQRLSRQYEGLLVEGAGSPAEINLRQYDIANMGFATQIGCPVILIADIDRGGLFAHLIGTLELLAPEEQKLISGFVINRFRGDKSLLDPGIRWLEERTGKPVLGVLPYLHGLQLDAEDALNTTQDEPQGESLQVVLPVLPHISNHTDFDPLRLHPGVNLRYINQGTPIPGADLIILPGSKSVRADLAWLRETGWEEAIRRHLRYGGKVIGICGGYQMLGQAIHDPCAVEGAAGSSAGIGLLEIETTLEKKKQLRRVCGKLSWESATVEGYEIHTGISTGTGLAHPLLELDDRVEGARSEDGQIIGTYLHGLFDDPTSCGALLRWAGLKGDGLIDIAARREADIERLADTIELHLDIQHIEVLLGTHFTDAKRCSR